LRSSVGNGCWAPFWLFLAQLANVPFPLFPWFPSESPSRTFFNVLPPCEAKVRSAGTESGVVLFLAAQFSFHPPKPLSWAPTPSIFPTFRFLFCEFCFPCLGESFFFRLALLFFKPLFFSCPPPGARCTTPFCPSPPLSRPALMTLRFGCPRPFPCLPSPPRKAQVFDPPTITSCQKTHLLTHLYIFAPIRTSSAMHAAVRLWLPRFFFSSLKFLRVRIYSIPPFDASPYSAR